MAAVALYCRAPPLSSPAACASSGLPFRIADGAKNVPVSTAPVMTVDEAAKLLRVHKPRCTARSRLARLRRSVLAMTTASPARPLTNGGRRRSSS